MYMRFKNVYKNNIYVHDNKLPPNIFDRLSAGWWVGGGVVGNGGLSWVVAGWWVGGGVVGNGGLSWVVAGWWVVLVGGGSSSLWVQ